MANEDGFEDVLGTGAIRKKYLKTNPDGKKAEFGDEVIMTYSSYTLDTNELITKDETVAFRIGDNETLAALELTARLLREGEVAEVNCEARYAYGNAGSFDEVANQEQKDKSIKFIISFDKWVSERKIPEEMTNEELIIEANKKKESGNRWYGVKNYAYATNCYKKAIKVLEKFDPEETYSGNLQCKELLVALGNNVANVQCKLGKYKEARDSSKEVLQVDPKNMKAIYRLAQIAYQQGDCDDAMGYIREALEIEPNNKPVRELIKLVKEKREQQKVREKELFGKKFVTTPAPAEESSTDKQKSLPESTKQSTEKNKSNSDKSKDAEATEEAATTTTQSPLQNNLLVATIVLALIIAVVYAQLSE